MPAGTGSRGRDNRAVLREVAEYPNSFGPLSPGAERIETERYTLCLGVGSTWNTVQRQRFPLDKLDDVLEEVRAQLRQFGFALSGE